MRAHDRYATRLEGSGEPFLADLVRTPPGSTVQKPLSLTGVVAKITVKRYGGTTHGEVVINDKVASVSAEVAHRVEYVPTSTERRALSAGSYQVYWHVTRNGRALPKGPLDLVVESSPYGAAAQGSGLVFSTQDNSGLLAVI